MSHINKMVNSQIKSYKRAPAQCPTSLHLPDGGLVASQESKSLVWTVGEFLISSLSYAAVPSDGRAQHFFNSHIK